MTRKQLIGLIREQAVGYGYTFYTGFDYNIPAQTKEYPALWLAPPRLVKKVGRLEGSKYYDVELQLLDICRDGCPEREKHWARMEDTASKICLSLGVKEGVVALTGLNYSPTENCLTPNADVSLKVGFMVQVNFCEADYIDKEGGCLG